MSEIKVYIDNFNKAERKVCESCPASGQTYRGMIPFPLCKPAQLERNMGRTPTYNEAEQDRIKMTDIPKECPNGYISLSSCKIR